MKPFLCENFIKCEKARPADKSARRVLPRMDDLHSPKAAPMTVPKMTWSNLAMNGSASTTWPRGRTQPADQKPFSNRHSPGAFDGQVYRDAQKRVGKTIVGGRLGGEKAAKVQRDVLGGKLAACHARISSTS